MVQPERMMLQTQSFLLVFNIVSGNVSELHCPNNKCNLYGDYFEIGGRKVEFAYKENDFIKLQCHHSTLDLVLTSLPRFNPPLRVNNIILSYCASEQYSKWFEAMNIIPVAPLNLELKTAEGVWLDSTVFNGLPRLQGLTLRGVKGQYGSVFRSLEGLTVFKVERTLEINSTALFESLPRSLVEVRLDIEDVERVPDTVLNLPELRSLYVNGGVSNWHFYPRVVSLGRVNSTQLKHLHIEPADHALLSEWIPPAVEDVYLGSWRAMSPQPIPTCPELVKLTLYDPYVKELPAGFVARCPRLEVINITRTWSGNLRQLPAGFLSNATSLTSFTFKSTGISSLPPGFFSDTPLLTHLDLSENLLKELPSGIFSSSVGPLPLLSLDLSTNRLTVDVTTELIPLTELRQLSLRGNRDFGEFCPVDDSISVHQSKSALKSLSKLEFLNLQQMEISVICKDWREDLLNLKHLDLRVNVIQNLTYEDFQFNRNIPAEMSVGWLFFNTEVHFTAEDYDRAAAAAAVAPPNRNITLNITPTPNQISYCNLYWLTKALNDKLLPLNDVILIKYQSIQLSTRNAEELLCKNPMACGAVPAGCECGMDGEGILRVICVGIQLKEVPRVTLTDNVTAVDLVLTNNSITELVFEDLPRNLRILDLRNNSLSYISAESVLALVSGRSVRVLLAGNRLACSCRAVPTLRVLRHIDHHILFKDKETVHCEDGRTLDDAVNSNCEDNKEQQA